MTTQDDITIVNGDEQMGFHCRVCHEEFEVLPIVEVYRRRADHTLDPTVRVIVARHLKGCTGPNADVDPTKKKGGGLH
jgi:hypothetical protein